MHSPRLSTICLKTSGETRQSLNIASRRCAHAGVIFSPPHLGLSIGHTGWKRLIQQEVTGCNEGQKMRDSKYMRNEGDCVWQSPFEHATLRDRRFIGPKAVHRAMLIFQDLEASTQSARIRTVVKKMMTR